MITVAKNAALKAGAFVMSHFMKLEKDAVRKKSRNDFLSFVDENSEKSIVETIHSVYPDHDILAEEFGEINQKSPYRWIIDPLDGTTNYISGIPVFAISIALQYEDEIILGIVYDPVRDELFRAEKGKGAFCNDLPVRVSGSRHLSDGFIATGFPFKAKHMLPDYLKAFEAIFRESVGARRLGAAALDLAYVASGRFDGYWELGLSPWDMAAGSLLVQEAGGRISDFWDQPYFLTNSYVIASNGMIHREMCEKIQLAFPFYKNVHA